MSKLTAQVPLIITQPKTAQTPAQLVKLLSIQDSTTTFLAVPNWWVLNFKMRLITPSICYFYARATSLKDNMVTGQK